MPKLIKIVLSGLLLLCLAQMPYGYYQFVRFAAMIAFGLLAYYAEESNQRTAVIIYVVLALLFQPFYKIALGRELWNVVDVLVAIGLLVSLLAKDRRK